MTTTQETLSLPLRGSAFIACSLCADRLLTAVDALPGVQSSQVDTASGLLTVAFDARQTDTGTLKRAVERISDDLVERYGHRTYRVEGMDCADCARSVEKTVQSLPGVLSTNVNFTAAKMRIEFEPGTSGVDQVVPRLRSLGYAAEDIAPGASAGTQESGRGKRLTESWRVGISGIFLLLGLLLENAFHAPELVADAALGISILAGGYRFALSGLQALRTRTIGTNLLMAVASVGAIVLGHWEEAAAVVFLYALGEALEGAAMQRTRQSLRSLIDAAPAQALVQRGGLCEETIPATEVVPGDILVLKPGAQVAADGVVVSGTTAVSEAAITGESLPREKGRGDRVYAGSVNGNGSALVRVTAAASDTTLARILHLVEEAQAQKARTQALVERFGRVYTPLVLVSAVLLAAVGPLVAPGVNWIYRALTLLVVSCPCALIIATPVAYVSGIARAARGGVLVKGGAYLEALASVRHIALDKTGTLTIGQPRLAEVYSIDGDEDALLALAAAAERFSEHPIGAAVYAAANRRGVNVPDASDATAVPGRGIVAQVAGEKVLVGTPSLLSENGVSVPEDIRQCAERFAAQGKTTLLVARAGVVRGVLAVADAVREEARDVIRALRRDGIAVSMLTGDSEVVANAVGQDLEIEDRRARLLPEDKLNAVRELSQRPGGVAFAGDGINDAPALAAATVGIAMGAGGTAAALEAADVALMRSDLRCLPWALRLARRTRSVVRQNVAISLGVVAVLLLSTVTGFLSLPLGVLGHEGSALLVIANGMRLLSPRLTRL